MSKESEMIDDFLKSNESLIKSTTTSNPEFGSIFSEIITELKNQYSEKKPYTFKVGDVVIIKTLPEMILRVEALNPDFDYYTLKEHIVSYNKQPLELFANIHANQIRLVGSFEKEVLFTLPPPTIKHPPFAEGYLSYFELSKYYYAPMALTYDEATELASNYNLNSHNDENDKRIWRLPTSVELYLIKTTFLEQHTLMDSVICWIYNWENDENWMKETNPNPNHRLAKVEYFTANESKLTSIPMDKLCSVILVKAMPLPLLFNDYNPNEQQNKTQNQIQNQTQPTTPTLANQPDPQSQPSTNDDPTADLDPYSEAFVNDIKNLSQDQLLRLKKDILEALEYLEEDDEEKKELEIQLELLNLYLE